jgi:alkanesulfonate monooxygenase SsuD/methylene tetrahydromethanopterin reductase-like flavin-dependent oxidoreductase (luciferase family)
MEFSIIFEAQTPHGGKVEERDIIRQGVDQAVFAEQMGLDRFWAVEHHTLEWYAHMSAPEVFLTYVAAKTTRIRVGHGVVCLPFVMNHPIRVAERVAMLDILSNGRVDFGAGRGGTQQEAGAFSIQQADTYPQLEASLRAIPRMWTDDYFEFESELLNIPRRPIRPRPVQEPHPPIYLACTRPETLTAAGKMGLGALCLGWNGPDDIAEKRKIYDAGQSDRKADDVIGAFATNHLSALCPAVILEDREQAQLIGIKGQRFFAEALDHWYGKGDPPNPTAYETDDNLSKLVSHDEIASTKFGNEQINVNTGKRNPNQAYGTVADAIDHIERLEAAGADEVLFLLQMGTIPHSVIMQTIENIGRHVIPHFRKVGTHVFSMKQPS